MSKKYRFTPPQLENIKFNFIKSKTEKLINLSKELDRILIISNYEINENCSICFQSMKNKKTYHLPCGHVYHIECLKRQVKSMYYMGKNCALCRKDLTEYIKIFPNLK